VTLLDRYGFHLRRSGAEGLEGEAFFRRLPGENGQVKVLRNLLERGQQGKVEPFLERLVRIAAFRGQRAERQRLREQIGIVPQGLDQHAEIRRVVLIAEEAGGHAADLLARLPQSWRLGEWFGFGLRAPQIVLDQSRIGRNSEVTAARREVQVLLDGFASSPIGSAGKGKE